MGPDGEGEVDVFVVLFHKLIHPAGEIGEYLIVEMDKHNLFAVFFCLNQLINDTFHRPGAHTVDALGQQPPQVDAAAVGAGEGAAPGSDHLIAAGTQLWVSPGNGVVVNEAGPGAVYHRNAVAVHVVEHIPDFVLTVPSSCQHREGMERQS